MHLKSSQILSNPFKSSQILSDPLKSHHVLSKKSRASPGIFLIKVDGIWEDLRGFEKIWKDLTRLERIWDACVLAGWSLAGWLWWSLIVTIFVLRERCVAQTCHGDRGWDTKDALYVCPLTISLCYVFVHVCVLAVLLLVLCADLYASVDRII